jgi:amino acid transporter
MHRFALGLMVASATAIAVAYASAFLPGGTPPWGPWLLAFGTATIVVAAMVLGAARGKRGTRVLAVPFLFTFVVIAGGFGLALLLADPDPAHPVLWLGLPRRAAIVLYGTGLLPMLVLPLAYALTFERTTLTSEDWQRVRDAAREVQAGRAATDTAAQPRAVVEARS